ncbi:MAG: 50S ribosomal protein L4 [Desulfohalobiaceae bacterium]|nr:50S ribosomal protein L4 [Desulfohalobiaceae bacterium]
MAVVRDQENNQVGEIELVEEIFGVEVKPEVLHQVVKAHLAAKRVGTASCKTRSNIRGGGAKPWRQKGTGRARAGTRRSPLWNGGAVTHGPTPRSYQLKVNKKLKKAALKMALSGKLMDQSLLILDEIRLDRPKTRDFLEVKNKLALKKALIVLPKQDNNVELATRNVPGINVIEQSNLNVYDILNASQVILTKEVIEHLQERLQ